MMLRIKLSILLSLLCITFALAQQPDDIIGKYHLPNNLDIEIFKNNKKYFGRIIALNNFENGQTKDINNPDELKQKEALIGKIIIKNLHYSKEEKQWIDGSMYGPEKGMVFNLKITDHKESEIVVVGSKYLFWKTLIWKGI